MEILFTALKVLDSITKEKESFSVSINKLSKGKSFEENKKTITTLVGCALRHYLILDNRISSLEEFNKEYKNAFILVASNLLFAKKVSEKESMAFLKQVVEEIKSFEFAKNLIESFVNGEPLIPAELDPNSLEFLSFRYNTPLWLIKMWRKHYGYKAMRKTLMANSKHFNNYGRINNEYIDEERFEIEHKLFTKTQFDKFYLYNDKSQVKKSWEYINKLVYVYPIAFDEMIKEADTDNFRGIAAFAATPNNLLSALSANLTSYVECDYLIGKQQAYFEIKQEKGHYNLKNAHLYEGDSDHGITCFSKKVHTFFVMPDSSKFFLLRNTPDYFIRFEQNSLDELIQNQEKAIEECSKFVEDDGYLVYEVATMSNKETTGIIQKFLANHKDFVLVNEKQIFPFSEYDSTMYYAILRKVATND